ncbi:MAG: PTS-dependent dihydroxyacetone kinase phosphotransferase subunit DhaM [Eubacteriaceae bacterium]|nr:PTS-dependent dihydroxyacetone kinase phosphotransferase subunit DhaM [Eubacteriaceae bacterium]MBR0384469.1 PTS-dependent dihydroxyacetone kinase phosphotransferase subunit DhaM [Eubacteriaceae bacterium]
MAKNGIILVSHSEQLANGVAELIGEMADDNVVIKAVGGTGDGRLGTNAMNVMEAIEEMAELKNILVYCDLGSSVLSTETAIEMVDEELQEKVHIVDAPLVEGAFYGVVKACVAETAEEVIEESKLAAQLHKV